MVDGPMDGHFFNEVWTEARDCSIIHPQFPKRISRWTGEQTLPSPTTRYRPIHILYWIFRTGSHTIEKDGHEILIVVSAAILGDVLCAVAVHIIVYGLPSSPPLFGVFSFVAYGIAFRGGLFARPPGHDYSLPCCRCSPRLNWCRFF